MGLRDRQQGDRQQIVMRFRRRRKFRGLDPGAISTISMPDSHVLPSLQAASRRDAAIGCQDENDAADQRQEIEESLRKEVSQNFTSGNLIRCFLAGGLTDGVTKGGWASDWSSERQRRESPLQRASNFGLNLVSPEGIEPSTNRLRVCCSAS